MTLSNFTGSVIQFATTLSVVLFAVEVTVRTACITWQEIRRAWKERND
jgi:hypothetical protein